MANDGARRDLIFNEFLRRSQFVEEALRLYISFSVEKIGFTNYFKPYSKAGKLNNMSMGMLITEFKKYSSDKELIKALDELRDMRNEIVHKEFLVSAERQKNTIHLVVRSAFINKASELAHNCFTQLMELSKIDNRIHVDTNNEA